MARKALLSTACIFVAAAALAPSAGAMNLARLIAPTTVCANQTETAASFPSQEQAMRCMTNYARQRMGEGSLDNTAALDRSARDKADDIIRCDNFSHFACGRQFTYWMQRVGYIPARCWRAGENLAWGTGSFGSVRSIFRTWIHSPEHRANILGPYRQIGVGLVRGRLEGQAEADVWTQHFGSHCGAAPPPAAPHFAAVLDSRVAR